MSFLTTILFHLSNISTFILPTILYFSIMHFVLHLNRLFWIWTSCKKYDGLCLNFLNWYFYNYRAKLVLQNICFRHCIFVKVISCLRSTNTVAVCQYNIKIHPSIKIILFFYFKISIKNYPVFKNENLSLILYSIFPSFSLSFFFLLFSLI